MGYEDYHKNTDKKDSIEDQVNKNLYNNQHYSVAANRRNLNARLKPSVFPSRHSVNGHNSDMDYITRKRVLSHIPSSVSSSNSEKLEKVPSESSIIATDMELMKSFMNRIKSLENELLVQRQSVTEKDVLITDLMNQILSLKDESNEKHTSLVQTMNEMIEYMNLMELPHKWKKREHGKGVDPKKATSPLHSSTDEQIRSSPPLPSRFEQNPSTAVVLPKIHHSNKDTETHDIGSFASEDTSQSPTPSTSHNSPPRLNMEVVKRKFKELNSLLLDQEGSIMYSGQGNVKKITMKPKCNVVFYRNGIVVDEGSFRPYEWDITRAFLNDVADGYFPYEFKEKHPDGVTLVPIDRSTELCTKNTEMDHKLSDYKNTNIRDVDYLRTKSEYEGALEKMNSDTFLSQLPKSVIRNGKVIPIRSDIQQMIKNPTNVTTEEPDNSDPTHDNFTIPTDCERYSELRPDRRKTVLKVSVYNGSTYTMTMWIDETIGDAKRYLQPYIQGTSFQLRTAFPPVVLSDDTATLEEAKLLNAKLVVMK